LLLAVELIADPDKKAWLPQAFEATKRIRVHGLSGNRRGPGSNRTIPRAALSAEDKNAETLTNA
jgi:hypothetical protein